MSVRKLESLNRCVIPKHIRKQLKIGDESKIMIFLSNNELIACKYTDNLLCYNHKCLAGIPRKIDSLGRLVIPIEYVRQLNFQVGELLEIEYVPEMHCFSIRRKNSCCILCGNEKADIRIDKNTVCNECVKKIVRSFSLPSEQLDSAV